VVAAELHSGVDGERNILEAPRVSFGRRAAAGTRAQLWGNWEIRGRLFRRGFRSTIAFGSLTHPGIGEMAAADSGESDYRGPGASVE